MSDRRKVEHAKQVRLVRASLTFYPPRERTALTDHDARIRAGRGIWR